LWWGFTPFLTLPEVPGNAGDIFSIAFAENMDFYRLGQA